METHQSRDEPVGLDILKVRSTPVPKDVDFGEVLETYATPEMERKVLWKLDLL